MNTNENFMPKNNNDSEISSQNELLPAYENLEQQASNNKLTIDFPKHDVSLLYTRLVTNNHLQEHAENLLHRCTTCERVFTTKIELWIHLTVHLGNKPYICNECTMCFTTSEELSHHVRYNHINPFKCKQCNFTSFEISKLRVHMRFHTGIKSYQCPQCIFTATESTKLKRHMFKHTGEKPYECYICHVRFTQFGALRSHKMTHDANRPVFQCEFCPSKSMRKGDLRKHVKKMHGTDTSIVCMRCNISFADRYTYNLHAKIHDGEACPYCNRRFKGDLIKHMELHKKGVNFITRLTPDGEVYNVIDTTSDNSTLTTNELVNCDQNSVIVQEDGPVEQMQQDDFQNIDIGRMPINEECNYNANVVPHSMGTMSSTGIQEGIEQNKLIIKTVKVKDIEDIGVYSAEDENDKSDYIIFQVISSDEEIDDVFTG